MSGSATPIERQESEPGATITVTKSESSPQIESQMEVVHDQQQDVEEQPPLKKMKTQSPTPQPIPQLNTEQSRLSTSNNTPDPSSTTGISSNNITTTITGTTINGNASSSGDGDNIKPAVVKSEKPNYEIIDGSELRRFMNKNITGELLDALKLVWKLKKSGELGEGASEGDILIKLGELLIEMGNTKNSNGDDDEDKSVVKMEE